jgi:hypothetical protein
MKQGEVSDETVAGIISSLIPSREGIYLQGGNPAVHGGEDVTWVDDRTSLASPFQWPTTAPIYIYLNGPKIY